MADDRFLDSLEGEREEGEEAAGEELARSAAAAEIAAAAAPAALRLHATVCQQVFWTAALPPARQALFLPFGGWRGLAERLNASAQFAKYMQMKAAETAVSEADKSRTARQTHGACAAQWEAMQQLTAQLGPIHLAQAEGRAHLNLDLWAAQLAWVAGQGPAALLGPAVLQELRSTGLAAVRHGALPVKNKLSVVEAVMQAARLSARLLAVVLLDTEVLDLLISLPGRILRTESLQLLTMAIALQMLAFHAFYEEACRVAAHASASAGASGMSTAQGGGPPSSTQAGGSSSDPVPASSSASAEPLAARLQAAVRQLTAALPSHSLLAEGWSNEAIPEFLERRAAMLPKATAVAALLQHYWQQPEQVEAAQLELAQAVAA